jgi:hypothetical protein
VEQVCCCINTYIISNELGESDLLQNLPKSSMLHIPNTFPNYLGFLLSSSVLRKIKIRMVRWRGWRNGDRSLILSRICWQVKWVQITSAFSTSRQYFYNEVYYEKHYYWWVLFLFLQFIHFGDTLKLNLKICSFQGHMRNIYIKVCNKLAAVILLVSLALIVQVSLPYNNSGRASVLYNFILVFLRVFVA